MSPRERYEWEKGWPNHVESIGIDRLDLLGVDCEGRLYWQGEPVEVRRSFSLSWWQRVGAILVTTSAVVAAVAAAASALADWRERLGL